MSLFLFFKSIALDLITIWQFELDFCLKINYFTDYKFFEKFIVFSADLNSLYYPDCHNILLCLQFMIWIKLCIFFILFAVWIDYTKKLSNFYQILFNSDLIFLKIQICILECCCWTRIWGFRLFSSALSVLTFSMFHFFYLSFYIFLTPHC